MHLINVSFLNSNVTCFTNTSRLSAFACDRLRDNNAAIADLSDENRPINLGEKFSELYDNQWTDAMERLEGNLGMTEMDAIQCLLDIIKVDFLKFINFICKYKCHSR